jgi:adenylate cyclase
MVEQPDGKRVSAVLMADVAGYSRLMGENLTVTVGSLKACRGIFSRLVAESHGRVVNAPGDSILAEFPTACDALEGALHTQHELEHYNGSLPPERRMQFRIGISLGEILADEDGIYGDEVNIAARLETLAEPGGICISSIAHCNLTDPPPVQFEFLGEQRLKNISRPIPVYRVLTAHSRPRPGSVAAAHLDKPSIAVLPFNNFSDDSEQDYFADGMTEDIITELSRFKSLFVIARNSSFVYKGRSVTVQQVARDLGVQYVLEGSVRRMGNRVRISAQLVDAADGRHLWADRFDRDLDDMFTMQDEIVRMIVANLPRRMEAAALETIKRQPTENMAAYELLLRAKDHHHRRSPEDNAKALDALDKAIELDPEFALAYSWKACVLGQAMIQGYQPKSAKTLEYGLELVTRGIQIDSEDSEGQRLMAELHLLHRRHEEALRFHERAIALNPNDPRIVAQRGQLLTWMGKGDEAVSWIELARRLDPYPPDLRADSLGLAHFVARSYAEAVRAYRQMSKPDSGHLANLAACYALLGEAEQAEAHRAETLRLAPGFTTKAFMEWQPYQHPADAEHHIAALQKAGLP